MTGRPNQLRSGSLTPFNPSTSAAPPAGWMPPAPPPAGEDAGGIPWTRYFAALRRFKWMILLVIVVGSGLGAAATRLIAPEYEVQATIWINSSSQSDRTRGPIRAGELLESIAWVELFRSFAIADAVVERLGLYVTPRLPGDSAVFRTFTYTKQTRPGRYVLTVGADERSYTLRDGEGNVLETGTLGDSVGRSVGFQWVPPARLRADREVEFRVSTPRDASVELTRSLATSLPEESNFLRLRLTGHDPNRIAATLNAWAGQFVSSAARLKKRNLVDFESTLAAQLLTAERELRAAEIALESFRTKTITAESDNPISGGIGETRAPVLNNFFEKKQEFDELRHDRETLERAIARVESGELGPDALLGIPGLERAPSLQSAVTDLNNKQAQLRAARQTYTEEHPTVRQLAASVRQLQTVSIPNIARSSLEQLRTRERTLSSRITQLEGGLRDIPARTIEEMRLRRQVQVTETLYNTLKARYEEAKLAEASATPDVTVLDSAVAPLRPSSNTAPRIVMLAIVASIGAAIGLALLLDRLDRRFRYPDQATKDLRLQVLGAVPHLRNKMKRGELPAEFASQVLESFRSLRLGVHYSFPPGERISLAVTSPGIGEGKSLISSNLALSFAEAGYRTVLVDGDIRRGELHRVFGVERTPGLIDGLSGDALTHEVLRPTGYSHLTLVPCGTRRHRGPEMLTSDSLAEFVRGLQQEYDVVIIDTPPLNAGIDAFALSTMVGHMLLVLRVGTTDRHLAESKLKTVDRLPIRVLGAVLNSHEPEESEYYPYAYATTSDVQDELPRGGSLRSVRDGHG